MIYCRTLVAACAACTVFGLSIGPQMTASAQVPAPTNAKKAPVFERSIVEVAPAKNLKFGRISIDNRLGSVRIVGHTGRKVIIEAVKRAGDRATLERLKVALVSDPDGNVRIGTSIATGRDLRAIAAGSAGVDLIVRAPNSARAVGRIWNGKLVVVGMENGAELIANEGDIEVSNALGKIVTRSAQGKQLFSRIVGSIDARGLIGDMELAMIGGKRLTASVHNGNIIGRKLRVNELALRTMKGNIELHVHLVLGGKYKVSTFAGNIRVTFGNRIAMRVKARAPNGKIDLPRQLKAARKTTAGVVVASYNETTRAPAMLDLTANVGHIAFAF